MNRRLDLLHSPRVTEPTRAVLRERLDGQSAVAAAAPRLLDAGAFGLLCVVVDRLVPQGPAGPRVPVAAIIDAGAAEGVGDGWRYDVLPPDDVALQRGLVLLDQESHRRHGKAFVDADAAAQDALLHAVQAGEVDWPGLDAARWFEELLAAAAIAFVADPRTLGLMHFDGLAFLPLQTADDIALDAPPAEDRP